MQDLYLKNDFLSSYDGIKYIKFTDFVPMSLIKFLATILILKVLKSGVSLHDNLLIATVFGDASWKNVFWKIMQKKLSKYI